MGIVIKTVIRVVLGIALVYGTYTETGIWTTVAITLLVLSSWHSGHSR